jgi:hypothetical protein
LLSPRSAEQEEQIATSLLLCNRLIISILECGLGGRAYRKSAWARTRDRF